MSFQRDARSVERLTPRELQVLAMTAEGLTAKEVARRLGISRKTVEQHRGRILMKLGVPNQAAAIRQVTREEQQPIETSALPGLLLERVATDGSGPTLPRRGEDR